MGIPQPEDNQAQLPENGLVDRILVGMRGKPPLVIGQRGTEPLHPLEQGIGVDDQGMVCRCLGPGHRTLQDHQDGQPCNDRKGTT